MTMLQIGPVTFETSGPHFDKLKHHQRGWVSQARFGRADARQWTGTMDDELTICGTIFTDYYPAGFDALGTLRAIQPYPQMVVSGAGDVFGLWCILDVSNEQTLQYADGVPRKVTFDLKLGAYGEDDYIGGLFGPAGVTPIARAIGGAIAAGALRLF